MKGVWLAVAAGVVLRLAVVLLFPDMPLAGDEEDYTRAAEALLAGGQDPWLYGHPPLYTLLCAGVQALAGGSHDAIRVAQALLEGATILGVALLARRSFGARAATWAAWLYALDPELVAYSTYLWSECLQLALLTWGLLALLDLHERPGVGRAAWAGALWGVACLVKPYTLYLFPLLLLALVLWKGPLRGARGLRLGALGLGVCVLAIVPWSLHASGRVGRPVVICTVSSLSLETGTNYLPPPQFDFGSPPTTTGKLIRGAPQRREEGVVPFILKNPGLYLSRAAEKLSYLWSPNSYVLRCLYVHDKYGPPESLSPAFRLGLVYSILLVNAALTVGLIVGLCFSRPTPLHALAVAFGAAYMAMLTLTPSFSRYRLPLMVFAIVFSAAWLAGQAPLAERARRPVATGLAAAGALLLLLVWIVRLPPVLELAW